MQRFIKYRELYSQNSCCWNLREREHAVPWHASSNLHLLLIKVQQNIQGEGGGGGEGRRKGYNVTKWITNMISINSTMCSTVECDYNT